MQKKFILIAAALALVASACSPGQPQISVESTTFSFGEVVNGEIVTQTMAITNTGNAPLVVDAVSTTCGCTTASLEAMEIPPGESSQLTIRFDSGAHGPGANGAQTRQVFIVSNDPAQPELVISFDALVLAAADD